MRSRKLLTWWLPHTKSSLIFGDYCYHESAFQVPPAPSVWGAPSAPEIDRAVTSTFCVYRIGCTRVSLWSFPRRHPCPPSLCLVQSVDWLIQIPAESYTTAITTLLWHGRWVWRVYTELSRGSGGRHIFTAHLWWPGTLTGIVTLTWFPFAVLVRLHRC